MAVLKAVPEILAVIRALANSQLEAFVTIQTRTAARTANFRPLEPSAETALATAIPKKRVPVLQQRVRRMSRSRTARAVAMVFNALPVNARREICSVRRLWDRIPAVTTHTPATARLASFLVLLLSLDQVSAMVYNRTSLMARSVVGEGSARTASVKAPQ